MAKDQSRDIFYKGAIPASFISESIRKHASRTTIGGHSIFLGQIREDTLEGKKVIAIEYSAYEEMALAQMTRIREDIFTEFPLECLHVYHSLGTIMAGEICFFVFSSSVHRKAAIGACDKIVDRIKKELPIWGKEILEDDSFRWKSNS